MRTRPQPGEVWTGLVHCSRLWGWTDMGRGPERLRIAHDPRGVQAWTSFV